MEKRSWEVFISLPLPFQHQVWHLIYRSDYPLFFALLLLGHSLLVVCFFLSGAKAYLCLKHPNFNLNHILNLRDSLHNRSWQKSHSWSSFAKKMGFFHYKNYKRETKETSYLVEDEYGDPERQSCSFYSLHLVNI